MISWRVLLWAVLVLAALGFLVRVQAILPPFILALLISALLQPVVARVEKEGRWIHYKGPHLVLQLPIPAKNGQPRPFVCRMEGPKPSFRVERGMSRVLAVGSILLSFFFVVIVGLAFIVPAAGTQLGNIRDGVESYVDTTIRPSPNDNFFVNWNPAVVAKEEGSASELDRFLESQTALLDQVGLPNRTHDYITKYVMPHRGEVGAYVQNFFVSFLGVAQGSLSQIFLMAFTPLLVFLILMDLDSLSKRSRNLIPPQLRDGTVRIFSEIYEVFSNYLRGVAKAIFGYMLVMVTVLTIAHAGSPIVIGIVAGVIYLIPYLGGAISALLVFVATGLNKEVGAWYFHTTSSWSFAFVVVLIFLLFHFAYDSIMFPRLVGNAVGLNPVLSMFVIFSAGALFGILGMLVAFPLAGTVKIILDRLLAVTMKPQETLHLPSVPIRHRAG